MSDSRPAPRHEGYLDGKAIITAYGRNEKSNLDQVRQHLRKHPTYRCLPHSVAQPGRSNVRVVTFRYFMAFQSRCIRSRAWRCLLSKPRMTIAHRPVGSMTTTARSSSISSSTFLTRYRAAMARARRWSSCFVLGEHQFIYQGELRHQLPRMWLILHELWSSSNQGKEQVPDSPLRISRLCQA